ncbi:MAG: type I methionyl aminopeptidase [Verrucomicrobia bacterium 21-51-4]|nr:MAG: type I methionyl aminopeptidase [Verrucomicrobia bacterium 21-51-4]HQU08589.1 type I methionyl aminopeptidase [Opitutales bacterium]
MIPIKTATEIESMRAACRVAATILDEVAGRVAEGVSTYDLDQFAKELFEKYGAKSACHGFRHGSRVFPAYTCLSVNEEVVHGIGSPKRRLNNGDNIKVDVSLYFEGFCGDTAKTVIVGQPDPKMSKLVADTEAALYKGIDQAKPGNRVGDISYSIQKFIESRGYSIVRDFVGHGVGRTMHEEPQIPNFGRPGTGPKLQPGMTLAIEPMVNMGKWEVDVASDGWTAVTRDGKPAAHFEHTILVTEGDAEILTRAAIPQPERIQANILQNM